MRILIYGDVHWSTYSSIVRSRGEKYSTRLEHLINSLNWVQQISKDKECDKIICLGDFFNSPDLTCEEISALREINWNENVISHFIVGNHESDIHTLVFNSTNALNKPCFKVEYEVCKYELDNNVDIYFLPYIIEDDRKPLKDYLPDYNVNKKHVIFSHNDLKGIQYGVVESKEGFTLSEIESCCDLFINGHLHNGTWVTNKILNLGILTGQNFTENAFLHNHPVCILDTATLQMEFIENPFAFNFYKVEINNENDLNQLDSLKANAVLSIKCNEKCLDILKEKLTSLNNIVESKTIIYREETSTYNETGIELSNNNYKKQFSEVVIQKLGSSDVVKYELAEVCK